MELLEVVVFLGGGRGGMGEEGGYVGEEGVIFGFEVEEDEEVALEVGIGDVGEEGVGAVDGGVEGFVVADADLEEDEEGEEDFGFLVGGGWVEGEEMGDGLFGVAPELGAGLDAVVFDGVEEEHLAVGLEAEGKEIGHGVGISREI